MNSVKKQLSIMSRRSFNKSVAAALISTPFAFAAAQEGRRAEDCKYVSPLLNKPCPNSVGPQGEPHEPPIGFDSGSLVLECVEKMHREGSVAVPPRKHLYDFKSYSYGHMVRLEIVSEYNLYYTYDCYELKDVTGIEAPKLKIWLQRLKNLDDLGEGEYPWIEDDILPNTEPHVLVRYRPLEEYPSFEGAVIESDKRFGDVKKGYKSEETFKHNHRGYGKRFRIGRWMLVNKDGTPLAGDCAGIKYIQKTEANKEGKLELLGFHLRPRFHHLGEQLRKFKAGKQRP
jgi:hypothetical protein